MKLSAEDQCELLLFRAFLERRATTDEPLFHSYAEVYGELVFEDTPEPPGQTPVAGREGR